MKRIIARIKVANKIPLGQNPEQKGNRKEESLKGPFLRLTFPDKTLLVVGLELPNNGGKNVKIYKI